MIYSIIDIETTGGSHGNRITEIAVCKTDGKKVTDRYETLINPGIHISHSITLLTGITNAMVEDAPRFEDIAAELLQFIEGSIFVAHNVSFDYSIIKNHYYDMGIAFNMKKLCTVRLSRGIIKNLPSYSLGKVCLSLGIVNKNRHRAMGDAEATAELFHYLVERDTEDFITYSLNKMNRETEIPPNLPKTEYTNLPESTGVYYFLSADMQVLYIGKAKNIKKRVSTHFLEKSRKKSELLRRIHHVSYELTGNELIALLLESAEIKKHLPMYNKAQRSKHASFYVSYYLGQDGFFRLDVFNKKFGGVSIASFTSLVMARDYLYQLVEEYNLCPKYTGLERGKGTCSRGIVCDICSGNADAVEYNAKVKSLHKKESLANLLILGRGRSDEEKAVVYISEGEYRGFGFLEGSVSGDYEQMISAVKMQRTNADTKRIINQFFKSTAIKNYHIIELEHAPQNRIMN